MSHKQENVQKQAQIKGSPQNVMQGQIVKFVSVFV